MSLAILKSHALHGVNAVTVTVEVHLANGLPSFTIVGLADTEVKESKDRVRAAIQTSHFEFPTRRITVNLAPADLPKEGGRFDLPIALGILIASQQLPGNGLTQYHFAGELGLGGELRAIRGVLPMLASFPDSRHLLPDANQEEAALLSNRHVYTAPNLLAVCRHLAKTHVLSPLATLSCVQEKDYPDLADVRGQQQIKRALEIAAAGQHHLLMIGPPGAGKSMLAQRLPGILPTMQEHQALEVASIYSLSNQGFSPQQFGQRPFRSPHHTASSVALVGGGSHPKPGEISLAHHGVLFLDELPEFDRKVLEVLREPLESGKVDIARANRQLSFPAQFQLIAAMNPCPCGYLGHKSGRCHCPPPAIARYQGKISGPLLDRIDMLVPVSALTPDELSVLPKGEASQTVQARVVAAHQRQLARQHYANHLLTGDALEQYCPIAPEGRQLLTRAAAQLHLSARSWYRIIRLARTIADLADSEAIDTPHIAEAIQFRRPLFKQPR
jgi:magnesium chelatase family protein